LRAASFASRVRARGVEDLREQVLAAAGGRGLEPFRVLDRALELRRVPRLTGEAASSAAVKIRFASGNDFANDW